MNRIGLTLGAGGITGEAFHRGVLRALHDLAGWDARTAFAIVGTSAGSLVAASLRAPRGGLGDIPLLPADAHEPLPWRPAVRPILRAVRRPLRTPPGVVATGLVPHGKRSTEFITSGIRRRYGTTWPEAATYIVAVRQRDGRRVVFGREGAPVVDMATAVGASIAIPGYFRPMVHGGETYIDGGAHSPTNADVLRGAPLTLAIVSSPMSVDLRSARARPDLPLRMMWHGQLQAECRILRRSGVPVVAIEPGGRLLKAMGIQPLAAHRIDDIEEETYARTLRQFRHPDAGFAMRALRAAANPAAS